MFTKEMQKVQKKAKSAEQKQLKHEEKLARQRIEKEDALMRQAETDKLKANEEAINREIEEKYKTWETEEEESEKRVANVRFDKTNAMVVSRLANMKEQIPQILANLSAKKLPNEEVMTAKEKWTIIRADVGKGAMAKLYKAKDPNQREMVVKVTPLTGDIRYCTRYKNTFPILRYLHGHPHPHIVQIFELYVTPDKAYVFMDLCEKMDMLAKIKRDGPFSEDQAYRYGREIGDGLDYLHSLGIAHENLKPDSVLFDQIGRCKLGGLGSCVTWYEPSSDTIFKQQGNSKDKFHRHFAPEKTKDEPYDPSRADVWSWGCLLVIMQTKEWPFEEKSKHSIGIQWKLCFKKVGKELTDTSWDILRKCFQVDAEQRPVMQEVLAELPVS